eukprot:PhF_6_TR19950/c0_g1_i2/m.29048
MVFTVHVAADLWGRKTNLSIDYPTHPTLGEFITKIEIIYSEYAESMRILHAPSCPVPIPFRVTSIQLYDIERRIWVDMCSSQQLSHNVQAFAFQPECVYHTDVQAPIPAPVVVVQQNVPAQYLLPPAPQAPQQSSVSRSGASLSPPRHASPPRSARPLSPRPLDILEKANAVYTMMCSSSGSNHHALTQTDLKAWLVCLGLDPSGDWSGTIFSNTSSHASLTRDDFIDFALRYSSIVDFLHSKSDEIAAKLRDTQKASATEQRTATPTGGSRRQQGRAMDSIHVSPARRHQSPSAQKKAVQRLATDRLSLGLSSHATAQEMINPMKVNAALRVVAARA